MKCPLQKGPGSSLNIKMILRHYFLFVLSCVSIVLQKTDGGSIPGIPGVDYPNFREIPTTSFRCPESTLRGFYPDFETRCQVFHYCEDGDHETFICPIGSIFNPLINSCDRWFNSECNAPPQYDEETGYDSQTDYGVASEGGVASLFPPSSSLFDKMASLYEDRPSEANGQYEIENGPRVNPNVDQYSEYGSSRGSSQYEIYTMGENEESRREVSEVSRDSEVSEDSANLKNPEWQAYSERDINMENKNEGTAREHTSESVRVDGYEGVGSYSDHTDQSSKGLGVLYYRNPTIYNYHTLSNEHDGNQEGDSIFYEGEQVNNAQGDSYSSIYEKNFDESHVDSDQSMGLQKRISEYRRRPRPKPVVSLVESDLEIVTLPPLRPKRPRMPLVQENAEPSVTEPMTTTTELSADVQHKSEYTEPSSASDDVTGDDDESQMSGNFQHERIGNERDFGDWFTEESSGDAEDFLQSEDLDESLGFNQTRAESVETDTNMEQVHSMMRPNLFYVDSSSDYDVKENVSNLDLSTDKSSDEQREENYGATYDYKNEDFGVDHKVQTEEYNHDDSFNKEIVEDSSEVLQSNQYYDNFDTEKYQYESKNEDAEDFGEMFQTVIDGEVKSLVRFGEEIIDPTEYFPDWKDESSAEREEGSFYDAEAVKASEKYLVDNSNGANYQSEESQDLNYFNLDQNMKTSSEASEGYQDRNSSPDFAADSAGTVSEEVTFIPNSEYEFATTQAYDTINADGVYTYDGSRDSGTMESFYTGDDIGFSDDQSYIHPAYTSEHATFEEQGATNEDIIMPADDDETSSSDVIYYYTTDMGSQFVTDQPDMDIATTSITDDGGYSENTDIHGDSKYVYEGSQSDDSDTDVVFKEEYFTTHSVISDIDTQFVTDQPDFVISSTAMPDGEEYSRDRNSKGESDVEFQEQFLQTHSYYSDLGTRYVTDQPDIEMSTTAMLDGGEYSKDTVIQGESRIALDKSNSDDSDSDAEFQEYLQAGSDFSELEDDFANKKESNTGADKVEQASDLSYQDETKSKPNVTSDTFSSVFADAGTSDISKSTNSNLDKSVSSETSQMSHSKETSLDSFGFQGVANFDFDSVEDTGSEKDESSADESSTDESLTSGDSKFKSQSACSTCPLSLGLKKRRRSFSSDRFEMMDRSRHPGRTGKLVEGSKLAKLASFLKKMLAAKKKAKVNIVKKILPSSEWNTQA